MPIHGIFYARFLPQEGIKIVAQSPPGCIVPVAVADESEEEDEDEEDEGDFDPNNNNRWDVVNTGRGDQIEPAGGAPLHSDADADSGSDSDSDGDGLDIKATRRIRTPKVYKTGSGSGNAGGGESDSGSDTARSSGSAAAAAEAARKRARAAAASASASALLGTAAGHGAAAAAASTSSSSMLFGRRGGPPQQQQLQQLQLGKPLFDFDVMSEYVIPRPAFFNCYLASRDPSGKYAVLGLPVAIRDSKYDRNEFIFNFGIVVDATTDDQGPYERVVRRLASTFAEMEKQNEFLSQQEQRTRGGGGGGIGGIIGGGIGASMAAGIGDGLAGAASIGNAGQPASASASATTTGHHHIHSPYHRRSIQSLLEIIKEDLNLYGECMIPVDDANTINMKLFPIHPNPPAVEGWHVPVPKMRLADTVDPSWDLTLQRVIAHMDGVSDVRRIAFEADISMELCRSALRHLLYYDTILLLDIFFFGSCYAPRPGIHDFIANVGGIVDECARYVCLSRHEEEDDDGGGGSDNVKASQKKGKKKATAAAARPRRANHASDDENSTEDASGSGSDADSDASHDSDSASAAASASSSSSPPNRPTRLSNFDLIRLMTSFCVGRTVTEWLKLHADAGIDVLRYVDVRRLVQFGVIKGCLYRVHKYVVSKQYLASLATGVTAPYADHHAGNNDDDDEGTDGLAATTATPTTQNRDPLQKYTDGQHHFDQIMTELNMTEVELVHRLKRMPLPPGDLKILYR